MKDDSVYLRHIIDCIRRIEEDIREGRERFMASHTLQDAVIRNLQTMAESTQRLSDDLKEAHPEIEWYRIAAFRNVLVHDYLGLDIEKIWDITHQDVPRLKQVILAMSWHVVQVENFSSVLCEAPDSKRFDTPWRRKAMVRRCERIQGGLGRIDRRTRMGRPARSSESGGRTPNGTARLTVKPTLRTHDFHAASWLMS